MEKFIELLDKLYLKIYKHMSFCWVFDTSGFYGSYNMI